MGLILFLPKALWKFLPPWKVVAGTAGSSGRLCLIFTEWPFSLTDFFGFPPPQICLLPCYKLTFILVFLPSSVSISLKKAFFFPPINFLLKHAHLRPASSELPYLQLVGFLLSLGNDARWLDSQHVLGYGGWISAAWTARVQQLEG